MELSRSGSYDSDGIVAVTNDLAVLPAQELGDGRQWYEAGTCDLNIESHPRFL